MFYLRFKKHEKRVKNYWISTDISIKKILFTVIVLYYPVRNIFDIAFVRSGFYIYNKKKFQINWSKPQLL